MAARRIGQILLRVRIVIDRVPRKIMTIRYLLRGNSPRPTAPVRHVCHAAVANLPPCAAAIKCRTYARVNSAILIL